MITKRKLPSDLEFIADPDRWPMWPLLPLKRHKAGETTPECVVCIRTEEGWPIFNVNPWRLPDYLEEHLIKTYASAEEVVADGWVVD